MATWQKILIGVVCIIAIAVVVYFIVNNHYKGKETEANQVIEQENTVNDVFNTYVDNTTNTHNEAETEAKNITSSENATNHEKASISTSNSGTPELKERTVSHETTSNKQVEVTGTNEQKAVALAKNTWGADDKNVTYNVARHEGNIYYVSVNSPETAEVLAWYKVDVEKREVSDY